MEHKPTLKNLLQQIENWRLQTIKEIQAYESRERSMELLKQSLYGF